MKAGKRLPAVLTAVLYALFLLYSHIRDFQPGIEAGENFLSFLVQMLKLLPFIFILVGLFQVWVKRSTVEKHLGQDSGFISYVWAILLAGTTVGGLYVALPVAHALRMKGARMGVVLAYLSASAICRIPMTVFEASFLGWKFSIVRLAVSLPLVVVSSYFLGRYLVSRGYVLPEVETNDPAVQ